MPKSFIGQNYFVLLKHWRVAHFVGVFYESCLKISQRHFVVLIRSVLIASQLDFLSVYDRIGVYHFFGMIWTGASFKVFFAVMYSRNMHFNLIIAPRFGGWQTLAQTRLLALHCH